MKILTGDKVMILEFKKNRQLGSILIYTAVIIFIFSTVMLAVLALATAQLRVIRSTIAREQAFDIAEAGINYYHWHLLQFPTDYQDGTGGAGPYVHSYTDTDAQTVIGKFSLQITPPPLGTTIVTVQSTGYTLQNPQTTRTITARFGVPSLAKYAFLTNSAAWIGSSESVSGQFMANGGVRFDGTGNAPIQSATQNYTCPGWQGSPCPAAEPGIWGSAPASTQAFWQYPVSNVDFSSLTADFATIKSAAQAAGIYLPPSNKQGYSLAFNPNGTVTVYKVTSLKSNPTGWDVNGNAHNENLDYNNRSFQFTQALPSNGLIYVEDKTWVEGTVAGRVMVAAALLPYNPSQAPDILIPNNIVYAAKDGSDVLGLMSQSDVLVTYYAPNNLEIDAAFIAQNGSAQFYYYPGNIKNTISIYGALSSFGVWTWSWVDGNNNTISGYQNTSTVYDGNLLYGPPPGFPLTSEGYQQISWSSN